MNIRRGSKGQILIVEDDGVFREAMRDACEHAGYSVQEAKNGREGLEVARRKPPEIILLDIMMPELDGYATCRELRLDPATSDIPIIMLSNLRELDEIQRGYDRGATDFRVKPPDGTFLKTETGDLNLLLVNLWHHILEYRLRTWHQITFFLEHLNHNQFRYAIDGEMSDLGTSVETRLDLRRWHREMTDLASMLYDYHDLWLGTKGQDQDAADSFLEKRRSWRRIAADKGRDLYKTLFNLYELSQGWSRTEQAIRNNAEKLIIRFVSPPSGFSLPFELLHEDSEPWSVRYPMARQIRNKGAADLSWRAFLRQARGKSIRTLLLAGDEIALEEIQIIAGKLGHFSDRLDLVLDFTYSELSRPIMLEEATSLLSQKLFDFVHFAGHAVFNPKSPDDSYLSLRKKDGVAGQLNVRQMRGMLQGSPIRFLYLSCCSGAEVADEDFLNANTYRGLVDAAVQAGVPNVLGYRWPVVGRSAKHFASYFYEGLIKYPSSLEHATWWARRQIFETSAQGGWDETWFSPILVVQKPDFPRGNYD